MEAEDKNPQRDRHHRFSDLAQENSARDLLVDALDGHGEMGLKLGPPY
jgi:hypothetical protein